MKKYLLLLIALPLFFSCEKDEKDEKENKIYVVPVVIHLIHLGEPIGEGFNLSAERIESQIQILNNDFRKKEGTLGYNESPIGGDALIEFKLAKYDPNGNLTDGIIRVNANDIKRESDKTLLPFDWILQYGYWDPKKYINIWVKPGLQDEFLGSTTYPHIDLPGLEEELKAVGEGIIINTFYFGASDIDSDANLGRTLTHEMGHFLGLYHLWGEKENSDCNGHDDYVEDTPPVSRRSNGCNSETVACNGQVALTHNYMDYISDACMNMFTIGQIKRMRYVLENAETRKPLITSSSIDR